MIKVKIKYLDDHIKDISITGHAGFDEYGKDIVCAAVSTMATTSVNNILSLEDSITADYNEDTLSIKVDEATEINQSILENMILMLNDLENDYQQNIIIKED